MANGNPNNQSCVLDYEAVIDPVTNEQIGWNPVFNGDPALDPNGPNGLLCLPQKTDPATPSTQEPVTQAILDALPEDAEGKPVLPNGTNPELDDVLVTLGDGTQLCVRKSDANTSVDAEGCPSINGIVVLNKAQRSVRSRTNGPTYDYSTNPVGTFVDTTPEVCTRYENTTCNRIEVLMDMGMHAQLTEDPDSNAFTEANYLFKVGTGNYITAFHHTTRETPASISDHQHTALRSIGLLNPGEFFDICIKQTSRLRAGTDVNSLNVLPVVDAHIFSVPV